MKEFISAVRDLAVPNLPTETYQRVGLGPEARKIAQEGVVVAQDDPFSHKHYSQEEADLLFPRYKAERYAVTSIIADRVVDRALDNRVNHPPLGFSLGRNYYNEALWWDSMNQALDRARREEFRSLDKMLQRPEENLALAQIYGRHLQLEDFGYKYYAFYQEGFENGLVTAVSVMFLTLDRIMEKYKRETGLRITPEELQVIARNSYGLVAELASNHLYSLISAVDLKSWTVDLYDTPKGKRLDLNDKGRKRLQKWPSSADSRRVMSDKTVHGCPALIAIDGSSPIKKLWDWVVEISPEIANDNSRYLRPSPARELI